MKLPLLKLLSVSCVALLVSACASSVLPADPNARFDSYFGALSASHLALIGEDANKNGIRDDVESYILDKSLSPLDLNYALLYARSLNLNLLAGSINAPVGLYDKKTFMTRQSCLQSSAQIPTLAKSIRDATLNTPERKKAFNRWIVLSEPLPAPLPSCEESIESLTADQTALAHTPASP